MLFEALDYLRESRAAGALIEMLTTFVELLRKPWLSSNDPLASSNRNGEALALSAVRALGRIESKRAEPVLFDLLLRIPMHNTGGDGGVFPLVGQTLAETQNAILAIRGEKRPAEFDCGLASLRLSDYQSRRHKADVEFGGGKRASA